MADKTPLRTFFLGEQFIASVISSIFKLQISQIRQHNTEDLYILPQALEMASLLLLTLSLAKIKLWKEVRSKFKMLNKWHYLAINLSKTKQKPTFLSNIVIEIIR